MKGENVEVHRHEVYILICKSCTAPHTINDRNPLLE